MPANQLFADWVTGDIITATKINQMKNDLAALSGAAFTGGISGTTASFSSTGSFSGLLTAGGGINITGGSLTVPAGASTLFDILAQDATDYTANSVVGSEVSVGSLSISPREVGDILAFEWIGTLLHNLTGDQTYTWSLYLGTTKLLESEALKISTNAANRLWRVRGYIAVESTTSQSVAAELIMANITTPTWRTITPTGAALAGDHMALGVVTSAINLGTTQTLDLRIVASATNMQVTTIHRVVYIGR